MTYAWIITEDHLAESGTGDAGIAGPSDVPADLLARVKAGEGDTFKLYDDDEVLYYTGRLLVDGAETTFDDEEACYAPLGDFGMGWAGCTSVKWPGHPERQCS